MTAPREIRRLVKRFRENRDAVTPTRTTTPRPDTNSSIQLVDEKTLIQCQIDTRIDKLVYGLYDLTDEEIRIVEEATSM